MARPLPPQANHGSFDHAQRRTAIITVDMVQRAAKRLCEMDHRSWLKPAERRYFTRTAARALCAAHGIGDVLADTLAAQALED